MWAMVLAFMAGPTKWIQDKKLLSSNSSYCCTWSEFCAALPFWLTPDCAKQHSVSLFGEDHGIGCSRGDNLLAPSQSAFASERNQVWDFGQGRTTTAKQCFGLTSSRLKSPSFKVDYCIKSSFRHLLAEGAPALLLPERASIPCHIDSHCSDKQHQCCWHHSHLIWLGLISDWGGLSRILLHGQCPSPVWQLAGQDSRGGQRDKQRVGCKRNLDIQVQDQRQRWQHAPDKKFQTISTYPS